MKDREAQKQKRNSRKTDKDKMRRGRKKVCSFCAARILDIDYKDMSVVRRFVNEKNKVVARRSTGACAKHQRAIAEAVRRAREMALLPYCTSR